MITDRTIVDVLAALDIRANKVQQGIALTEAEEATLERGMLTINTLNRIEGKQVELRELFNEWGYYDTPETNRTWDAEDVFTGEDAQRIISAARSLKRAFFVKSTTPNVTDYLYDFENVNAIEQICVDLEEIAEGKEQNFRICNTAICGA